MPDLATNLLLSVAVFAGAFVSGLAGFAFSAVAGAIVLRIFQPMEAVPLMMACSTGVQAANLWALRRNIQWEGSLLLIVGGALGIPIAVYLLQNMDTHFLRIGFGVIVVLYAGYMLFRPALTRFKGADSRRLTALIGFGGGLMGGQTAMPGAIPTIAGWSSRSLPSCRCWRWRCCSGARACLPNSSSTSRSACRRFLRVPC